MSKVNLQLGGGYVYQWECASWLALNYLVGPASGHQRTLQTLIENFLGQVEYIHLEGNQRGKNVKPEDVELEDVNMISGDKTICIQVKAKESENRSWAISNTELRKTLYRFYRSDHFQEEKSKNRFVLLSTQDFSSTIKNIEASSRSGTLEQCEKAQALFDQLVRYVNKYHDDENSPDWVRFKHLLTRLSFVRFFPLDEVEHSIKLMLGSFRIN